MSLILRQTYSRSALVGEFSADVKTEMLLGEVANQSEQVDIIHFNLLSAQGKNTDRA